MSVKGGMNKTGTAFGLPIPSVCVIRARERPMPTPVNKIHPALKHGGYAATAILPGENRADFEKLHQSLIAELAPVGALEDDIVATMARFVWRKQNLATVRLAELAGERRQAIRSEHVAAALAGKRGPISVRYLLGIYQR